MSAVMDKSKPKKIPDLGASFNDLEDGGMALFVWSKEQYRDVLELFSWFEEQLAASHPASEKGKAMKEKFERVEALMHKRVKRGG
jgi:hypothetical protein